MLGGLFGKKRKSETDPVLEEFRRQVETQGLQIDSVDEEGLIHISQGELTLKVSLDNLRRDYERDKDKSLIADFVQTLVSYTVELPANWTEAKDDIYISLFPNDYEFNDSIHHEITAEFSKVYVHSSSNRFSWITASDLTKWNITEAELDRQANFNADKLLAETTIALDNVEGRKLGLIETEHVALKGALLFAPAMKQKLEAGFGFPFYAVIPVRDFCYIFSGSDFDFFSQRIGKVVVDEYKQSGYPVTTEILKFSASGVEAVGRYPVE